ncbi:MAG: 50S ribosomal protein L13 [uncultured bacterium]|nr:MAG: 50S ribosomal protein L13 [uncultured bacterium]OGT08160.1 MAG: 50S ribosomal protein L13 [Gammaproteobacteria bacterium RBG_16_37_9]HBC72187.1 50S ribosomal protein L13 [Coxiellaceae bacterium]HBS51774.1 50S ribosomal protein L13 [Coxiellaceae bacterium]HBY55460.1 50S ribosomal protein L13 [Coxiellaceae bacterium]
MKTFNQSVDHKKEWYLLDAENKTLGRLATTIAKYLCGKNKPEYTPNIDTGDYIVVINAEKIHVTGNKLKDKKYYHHTGYQGGIKEISLEKQLIKAPELVLKNAVKGMLPKGTLGHDMLSKLKIYVGNEHKHQAQKLKTLTI